MQCPNCGSTEEFSATYQGEGSYVYVNDEWQFEDFTPDSTKEADIKCEDCGATWKGVI